MPSDIHGFAIVWVCMCNWRLLQETCSIRHWSTLQHVTTWCTSSMAFYSQSNYLICMLFVSFFIVSFGCCNLSTKRSRLKLLTIYRLYFSVKFCRFVVHKRASVWTDFFCYLIKLCQLCHKYTSFLPLQVLIVYKKWKMLSTSVPFFVLKCPIFVKWWSKFHNLHELKDIVADLFWVAAETRLSLWKIYSCNFTRQWWHLFNIKYVISHNSYWKLCLTYLSWDIISFLTFRECRNC